MTHTILQTLRAEHDLLRSMQELIEDTSGHTSMRDQLWFRYKEELLAHAWAEERSLYHDLKQHDPSRDKAEHSIEEHDTIEELVKQLDHLGFDQPEWLHTFGRLVHVSNHHLDEEEIELFPLAGRVLSDSAKAAAVGSYREAKLAYRTQRARQIRQTTHTGRDQRTFDAMGIEELRETARERGVTVAGRGRSELVSELRGAPHADA